MQCKNPILEWDQANLFDVIGSLDNMVHEFQAPDASLGPEALALIGRLRKVNALLLVSSLSAHGDVSIFARDVAPIESTWPTVVIYLREYLGRGHYESVLLFGGLGVWQSLFPAGHALLDFVRRSSFYKSGAMVLDGIAESKSELPVACT